MSEHLISLEIVTPQRIVFSDEVKSFTAPGAEGVFQILQKHAPITSTLLPGTVKFVTKDNETKHFATSGGTVEVHANKITMLAETIEAKDDIDVQRAEDAKQRAMKRLETKEGIDFERARFALKRAVSRINVSKK